MGAVEEPVVDTEPVGGVADRPVVLPDDAPHTARPGRADQRQRGREDGPHALRGEPQHGRYDDRGHQGPPGGAGQHEGDREVTRGRAQ